jgi:hypothetical protein
MQRPGTIRFVAALAIWYCVAISLTGCHSISYVRRAKERPSELWTAALKGFEGPVYYVGSEGDFSYFRAGTLIWTRYKAQTAKISLPRTFPLGKEKPYLVTQEMVYTHR